jgi:CTD kinase subunit alpha
LKKFFPGDEEEMDFTDMPSTPNQINGPNAEDFLSPQDSRPGVWPEFHDPTNNLLGHHPNEQLYGASYSQPALPPADIPTRYLDHDKALPSPHFLPSESLHPLSDLERLSPHRAEIRDIPPRSLQETEMRISPHDNHQTLGGGTCTPSKDLYKIVSQVGEGTFGQVYKARNTITGTHVALKRIRMESERDGFPVTAMREIKLLQSLRHENVVRLYEMMVSKGEF